ncbi:MAG: YeeE/YedE thiosulfate transporter family protein [Hyphomicrobiaceae bacterium]|nr:YeeE/YedE thiosulfate transporter family protein [Hyphomicrobiaceae bacterium]
MTEFTPFPALVGGTLIGIGAVMTMLFLGRIAGLSGMISGVLSPTSAEDWTWRVAFLVGMIAAPILIIAVTGTTPDFAIAQDTRLLALGGVLVGIGVTFGSGCASGHGICGLARLSPRSLVATAVFMTTAIITVFVSRHIIGA